MAFKYSLNTNALIELEPAKIAKLCSKCKLDGIEWGLPHDINEIQKAAIEMDKAARDNGLEVLGYINAGHLWDTDLMKKYSDAVGAVNGKSLRVSPPWLAFNFQESLHQKACYMDMLKLCRDGLEKLIPLSKEYKIKYVIEMHMGSLCSSAESARLMLDGLDPECIGIIYDPGNGIVDGFTRPRQAIEVLGPYLGYVHAKNVIKYYSGKSLPGPVKRLQWDFATCQMDAGMVDWFEVTFGLKTVGYKGWISFEEFFHDAPEDEIIKAIKFMKECENHAPSQPQPPFLTMND